MRHVKSRSGIIYTSAGEHPWYRTPRRERDQFIRALLALGVSRRTIARAFDLTSEGVRLAARRAA